MGASPGPNESIAQPSSTRMAGQEFAQPSDISKADLMSPSPTPNRFERAAQQAFGSSPAGLMLQRAVLGGLATQNKKSQN